MFVGYSKLLAGAVFALGFSLFGTAHAAPDPNFHIYIAYGQSNMGGTADAQSADKVEHPRFKIFATQKCSGKGRNTLGEVYPAVPSLFNCGNTISIADWFGRTMADSMPDVTIGIIPVAIGGASIKAFDKDQYASYLASAESWLQNYAKEYASDGNVYKTIVDIAKKAQQVGVIKGFIFHQGETDGGYSDWPKIVKKTRDDILKALDMSSDTVPFVAGELLREGCCYSDRVSKLPNTMDNTYYASSEGLGGNGVDRYHFNHDAYVTFGKRYAEQMLKPSSGGTGRKLKMAKLLLANRPQSLEKLKPKITTSMVSVAETIRTRMTILRTRAGLTAKMAWISKKLRTAMQLAIRWKANG